MANAISGWIPTMTVIAPCSRAISPMLRSVLEPKESMDVEFGDIDDDTTRSVLTDLLNQILLEPDHLGVVPGSVDRRDQVGTLPQDRDQRRPKVR